jgi:cobalt-precorrin-5B (C1)-methyltransferase
MKPLEHYLDVGPRRLRCGYTTGTCAAAASRAAAQLLLTGKAPASVLVETPSGLTV